ncbi:glycoside hydrolase family 127 protein [Roseateles oligotrophus]|uniref:Glycoside hydrolase family 127 protein n=1 Tax=Roseateles oligotrophus TaxID=1769250 RepID=A0ABT2YHP5_9BURK|nr:glycoside hydrolase family 127 protein [Roseateles oligotrophus]MCV2369585.1 glycoside hydrolase family 127 protein [Roseateles oligotrophus]
MMRRLAVLLLASACTLTPRARAAELFPLADVRLSEGPFLQAQDTDLRYLLALDADRLLAPFLREAGLPAKAQSYGNWESSGLDGHMAGHYLSALALMVASTGDAQALQRLNYVVAELKRCQEGNGNGYLGGIPAGAQAWGQLAEGKMAVDNFSLNGRWVPWYNLHKTYAGLLDAWRHAGSEQARELLIAMADWALALTDPLSDAQMQQMLRSEHGGMNEVFAELSALSGEKKFLVLAQRFSHQQILQPLSAAQDKLSGLHANTQIPKVIGFQRIAALGGDAAGARAAAFFWQTVVSRRTVAIGGNSVKEHFHADSDFTPMLNEVEGPETCNTYNMLKLTEALFLGESDGRAQARYADYYERALYNHILSSQRPGSGGFVYFTPMRANHYRVYSQADQGMWCCVGSGLESHAKYGEFIYAQDGDALYVNLFIASTLNWRDKGVRLSQRTNFPDRGSSLIRIDQGGRFALKVRYPSWVAAGQLRVKLNGRALKLSANPGDYVEIPLRDWLAGDSVAITLPMRTQLEALPEGAGEAGEAAKAGKHYAVLHGPIVLAAKTDPFPGERLNFLADDSRMGHIAQGPVCPQAASPLFVSDSRDFIKRFKPVAGQPLTFSAGSLLQGKGAQGLRFIPFFRLHDSRYTMYFAHSTPAQLSQWRLGLVAAERERLLLDAQTIDQVAPGEQQPESDHGFKGEGVEAGLNKDQRWRHARGWFSYELGDKALQAKALRLSFSRLDAGRQFDLFVNERLIAELTLGADAEQEIYSRDFALPPDLVQASAGKLLVKLVARPGSVAGGLYGLRLLR